MNFKCSILAKQAEPIAKMYEFLEKKSHQAMLKKYVDGIFKEKFPSRPESISLANLLDWELWPIFIRIYSM